MSGRIGWAVCCMVLLAVASPLPAEESAKTPLKLPTSSKEMRQYMQPSDSGSCQGCGIVTSVRRISTSPGGNAATEANDLTNRTGDAGVGDDIRTLQVVGSHKESSRKKASAGKWRVAVRYDDGSLATFDQADQPRVDKGQRIRVVSGRVEPR